MEIHRNNVNTWNYPLKIIKILKSRRRHLKLHSHSTHVIICQIATVDTRYGSIEIFTTNAHMKVLPRWGHTTAANTPHWRSKKKKEKINMKNGRNLNRWQCKFKITKIERTHARKQKHIILIVPASLSTSPSPGTREMLTVKYDILVYGI